MKILQIITAALCSAMFSAAVAADAPFAITNEENLQISWRGKPLVIGEKFNYLQQDGFAGVEKRSENVGKHYAVNHFGSKNQLAYRREAVLKNGGKEVEISFQLNIPAYTPAADGKTKVYTVKFNYADFANWKYTAVCDRVSRAKHVSGVLPANPPDGNLLKKISPNALSIRQVALESPDGKQKIVIDCSPEGVNDFYSDYPPNGIMSLWGFQKNGKELQIMLGYTPRFFGGSNSGKMQIYEGTAADYDKRHAARRYRYFSELIPDRQYSVAAENPGNIYTNIGTMEFNAARKAGWLDSSNITVETIHPSGAVYSAAKSNQPGTFRISRMRSGMHLITCLIPTYSKPIKNMNIAVDGKVWVKNLQTVANTVTIVNIPCWIEKGETDITFSGDWQLSTVNDQLLQASAEDFSFRRGFWVSHKGPHPAVMFQSGHYLEEPRYNVNTASYPLPVPGKEMANQRKTLTYPTGHAKFKASSDWRYGAMLGSWGTSNNGSFNEFSAPGAVERRIQELRKDKIDTVIINGLLSRHTYPHHIDRVEKMVAKIVAEGHKYNMKFIDHWDFSLLWQCDSGFRIMTERMDQLQHTVNAALPARGICPSNPITRKVFFDSVLRHIKATNIDGLMVDEVSFHGNNFCGCAWCRIKFTQDTGWVLPADETNKHMFNENSALWRTWIAWRQKAIGDFWVALRNEVKAIKPELIFIGYTTHYGMYSNYASKGMGSSMEQFARAWDFVGTEIMSRNVYASFRSVACFRKMKNMYKNVYGLPVFGLVYSDALNWDVMYFGWALNNLNAQTTWEMSGVHCPKGKPNYRLFDAAAGNMDKKTSKSKAEIAMLFSNYSRDCNKSASSEPDIMGFSQVMNANHIPHEFIFEEGLTPEILGKYKVLFVNNATAMSEKDVRQIRSFVEKGGTVYLSNFAGFYNEIAQKHKVWPVGKYLLDNSSYKNLSSSKYVSLRSRTDGKTVSSLGGLYVYYKYSPKLKVLMDLVLANGKTVPGLLCNKIGKGMVYFSPVSLGYYSAAYESTSKKPMNFAKNAERDATVLKIIKLVAGKNFAWQTDNVPEQVITSLYATCDGKIAAHFLNATKSNCKKGEIVPSVPPKNVFEPLKQSMSFTVKHPGKKAYAVSPEFAGRKSLPLKRNGEFARVTIPGGTLGGYIIVYVE